MTAAAARTRTARAEPPSSAQQAAAHRPRGRPKARAAQAAEKKPHRVTHSWMVVRVRLG